MATHEQLMRAVDQWEAQAEQQRYPQALCRCLAVTIAISHFVPPISEWKALLLARPIPDGAMLIMSLDDVRPDWAIESNPFDSDSPGVLALSPASVIKARHVLRKAAALLDPFREIEA